MNYETDEGEADSDFSSFIPLNSSFPKIALSQSFHTGSKPREESMAATSPGVT